ncbi:MAG: hypothetical protein FWD99_06225 [Oscillospiraceae bacterium]|nr:hypothetical protein [Oscillospiraceae bacterium]
MIHNYNDFCTELTKAGFSVAGGNDEGVFGLIHHNWNEAPPDGSPIRWHTGDPDTDPWEWRMRVLNERDDIAYAKMFFRKAGFITKAWYPYFLAVRRAGTSFAESYADGTISHAAKRIYEIVSQSDFLPSEEIKRLAGFPREEKSKFDRALTELQMGLYLTVCGSRQKTSLTGTAYSWPSMIFCTTERFWGKDVFAQAAEICPEDAVQTITEQIFSLNPLAQKTKVRKFIQGI